MPGVDGMDLRFDALTIAAGVLHAVDVVLVEHRQGRRGIGDRIVGGVQCLGPQEVPRRRHKRRVAEAGHLRHFPQTHGVWLLYDDGPPMESDRPGPPWPDRFRISGGLAVCDSCMVSASPQ